MSVVLAEDVAGNDEEFVLNRLRDELGPRSPRRFDEQIERAAAGADVIQAAQFPNLIGANGVSNLLNFAFGMNPNGAGSGVLVFNGTFGAGGTIGANGQPITMLEAITNGVDFRVLYVRRKDYVNAGLTYTVEFSPANLAPWTESAAVPAVLADNGTYQVVSVPFPPFIGGKKARFFRVRTTLSP